MTETLWEIDWVLYSRLTVSGLSAFVAIAFCLFTMLKARGRPIAIIMGGISLASFHYNAAQILYLFLGSTWIMRFGYAGAIALIPLMHEFPFALLHNAFSHSRSRWVSLGITGIFLVMLPTSLMFSSHPSKIEDGTVLQGGPFLAVYASIMGILLFRIAWKLAYGWFSNQDEMLKRRIEFILAGELIYCVCALHDILLMHRIFWIFPFPIVEFAALVFLFLVGYATLKFRLMEIEVVLGMGIYYFAITISIAAIYAFVTENISKYLETMFPQTGYIFGVLPALFVGLVFGPLQWVFKRVLDYIFIAQSFRSLKIFQEPNVHVLFLNKQKSDLLLLRDELDRIINFLEEN